jgi:hypothetical protein
MFIYAVMCIMTEFDGKRNEKYQADQGKRLRAFSSSMAAAVKE